MLFSVILLLDKCSSPLHAWRQSGRVFHILFILYLHKTSMLSPFYWCTWVCTVTTLHEGGLQSWSPMFTYYIPSCGQQKQNYTIVIHPSPANTHTPTHTYTAMRLQYLMLTWSAGTQQMVESEISLITNHNPIDNFLLMIIKHDSNCDIDLW